MHESSIERRIEDSAVSRSLEKLSLLIPRSEDCTDDWDLLKRLGQMDMQKV